MENILDKLVKADSKVVQEGTKELKAAFKTREGVPALCNILFTNNNADLRQMAAVVLRRRFNKRGNWLQLDSQTRLELKNCLVQALINEQNRLVKNSIAQLIGLLGKHEFANGTWPELINFVQQCCRSSNELEQELGMYTLSIMTEISRSSFLEHSEALATLFNNILSNLTTPNCNLAYYTVITMKHIVPSIGGHQDMINLYHSLLPRLVEITNHFALVDATKTNEMLEIFEDLVDNAIGVIVPHIRMLVESCLAIVCNESIDTSTHIKAMGVIGYIIRSKSKLIQKTKLVEPVVDVVLKLMAKPPSDEVDEVYFAGDPDQFTTTTIASHTLDIIALNITPQKVVPMILARIEPSLIGNDVYSQKAAYLSLAVLSEGCADFIRTKYLEVLLKCIHGGIRSPNVMVRNAAFFALGQFSEYLQPEISQYAADLLPIFFDYLSQVCVEMEKSTTEPPGLDKMFYALQAYCLNLEDGLVPYLPMLMERLFVCMDPAGWSLLLKRLALGALDSVAVAVKKDLVPYFPKVFEILNIYINSDANSPLLELQSHALEALSSIIDNIEGDDFKPLAAESLQLSLKILNETDDPDVRKSLFAVFAALSNYLKADMAQSLPIVIEQMVASMQSSDGIMVEFKDTETEEARIFESDSSEDLDDTDDNQSAASDASSHYNVENAYNDEKEQACLSFREFCKHIGPIVLPYLEGAFNEIFGLLNYPNDGVREAAIYTLDEICITWHKSEDPNSIALMQSALKRLIPKLSELIHIEEDFDTVIACVTAYANLLEELKGDMFVMDGNKEAVINSVVNIFAFKTACQDQDVDLDCPSGEEDGGESEQAELLLESAAEVIPKFAAALHPDEFQLYFTNVLKLLSGRATNKHSVSQRSSAIGTLAECMKSLGDKVERFATPLLEIWSAGIKDSEDEVRNNSVYGLGEMILHGKSTLFQYYPDILNGLSVTMAQESSIRVKDNVCGAIAKMIICSSTIIPLAEVFPVLLQNLPLQEDQEENTALINCFISLYQQGNEVLRQSINSVISVVLHIYCQNHSPSDETRHNVCDFIRKLNVDFSQEFANVASKLDAAEVQKLQMLLSS